MPAKTEGENWRLKQLKQELQVLACKQLQLSREHAALCAVIGCLEAVACQHSHVSKVLQRLHPLLDDRGPWALQSTKLFSVKELLRLLPSSLATAITPTSDRHLHRSVVRLAPTTAAQHWSQAVRDLQMLLYLHSRSPAAAHDDLARCITELTRWSCAVYVFHPAVLQQLLHLNLQTMRHEEAPAEHWRAVWHAADLTDTQHRQLLAVKRFLTPKLLNLDAERRQLTAELAQLSIAAGSLSVTCSSSSLSGSGSDGSSNSSSSGMIEQRRWETAQQLSRVNNAWRVLTQLRSQLVVALLEPWQAAKIVVSAYPYMLLGGPLYQYLDEEPASRYAFPCASSTADAVAGASAIAVETAAVAPGPGQVGDVAAIGPPIKRLAVERAAAVAPEIGRLGLEVGAAGGWLSSGEYLVGGSVVGDNYSDLC